MVGTTVLAGGIFYIGYKAYRLLDEQPQPAWWQALNTRLHSLSARLPGRSKTMPDVKMPNVGMPGVEIRQNIPSGDKTNAPTAHPSRQTNIAVARPAAEDQAGRQRLLLAASALGLTTSSLLFYPPLRIAAIPVLIYLGVAPAQRAQQALRQDRQLTVALVETATLAFCVVKGYYLVGSLGAALYYLGQSITKEKHQQLQLGVYEQPPLWAWRQEASQKSVTLVSCLDVGDVIVVHAGEMVPVPGVVSTGVAWVSSASCSAIANAHPVHEQGWAKVMAGNQVEATTIIQVGCIAITVTPAPSGKQR